MVSRFRQLLHGFLRSHFNLRRLHFAGVGQAQGLHIHRQTTSAHTTVTRERLQNYECVVKRSLRKTYGAIFDGDSALSNSLSITSVVVKEQDPGCMSAGPRACGDARLGLALADPRRQIAIKLGRGGNWTTFFVASPEYQLSP